MTVTGIERQKRPPGRVHVFIDGEFAFGVNEEVLLSFGLRKGDPLEPQTLRSIISSEELSRAKQTALRYIGYRLRSEREIRFKLAEKEFPPEIIARVIGHLQALNIVDDQRFARAFVHDAQLRIPAGPRLLRQQLRLKGVSTPVIEEVLSESFGVRDEQSAALRAARQVIRRYASSRKNFDRLKQRRQVAQFLARRGFSWSVITPLLRSLFAGLNDLTRED